MLRFIRGIWPLQPGHRAFGKSVSLRLDPGEYRHLWQPAATGEDFLTNNDSQLAFASIAEVGKLFRQRKLSPVELTRLMLDRIARLNPRLNAYLTVCEEAAVQAAAQAERALCGKTKQSRRDRGPLHGIPISLKDNIYTKDVRTTGGSKILKDFVPLHDAPVVAALKKAGAIILGKTNMHEFAYGVTTENPHFGPTRNPWDLDRIPGGSSGGSAAALAAGLCYGSIGTDTGGSIRIPSSLCGIVGLKPGLGRVNADDVIPLSPTLDFVGPLARTVEDAALLLDPIFIRAKDERNFLLAKKNSSRNRFCFGIPKEFFLEVLDPEVRAAFESAIQTLQKQGARVKTVSLPRIVETEEAGNLLAWVEATVYHQHAGWFPGHASEYSSDVYKRLEMGANVTAVDYLRARNTRESFKKQLLEVFTSNDLDALVVPTTPIAATRLGEDFVLIDGNGYATRSLLLRLNRPANLAGVPAISVPCGLTKNGLPVGLQFIAEWTEEGLLLEIARNFERACPLNFRPNLDSCT
jgi:aspartyl-tRNA(Asn)/glutamyl-tRNA(Gln) amidotransferase subunit A